ncbi:MAG TPA: flagellar hook capping FlgD N-terminal domain-containing protein [Bryobacteraceae bacterium]|jgi:flagellar basal-body rod modification protein FlgD
MFPTVTSNSSTGTTGDGQSAGSTANPTVSKNMFLQLLVAQIRHQDPLNPADGVQFLTQLAQFTQLEQSMSMSTDLAAIRADLDKLVPQTQTDKQA